MGIQKNLRMKREEIMQKIAKTITFVIISSVFLALLVIAVKMMILQFFPKHNTCQFVCAHLSKETCERIGVAGGKICYQKFYPLLYELNLTYRSPFLLDEVYETNVTYSFFDLSNPKEYYPYFVEKGIPIECYCGFDIKTVEEKTSNYSIFVKKEIVLTVNYTDWEKWYYG